MIEVMDRKEYERRQRELGESPHLIKVNTPDALNVNRERRRIGVWQGKIIFGRGPNWLGIK